MAAGPIGLVVLRVAQSCASAWPRTLAAFLPGCVVVSDAWNHASMFETIRHSLAEKRIFAYNEFLFGCHTDVAQDGSRELGKGAKVNSSRCKISERPLLLAREDVVFL
jgi:hypothetical protein